MLGSSPFCDIRYNSWSFSWKTGCLEFKQCIEKSKKKNVVPWYRLLLFSRNLAGRRSDQHLPPLSAVSVLTSRALLPAAVSCRFLLSSLLKKSQPCVSVVMYEMGAQSPVNRAERACFVASVGDFNWGGPFHYWPQSIRQLSRHHSPLIVAFKQLKWRQHKQRSILWRLAQTKGDTQIHKTWRRKDICDNGVPQN